MKYYNFFKNKEIFYLTVLFVILSIIHIVWATLASRGLFIDGSLWFPEILNSLSENGYGFWFVDDRTRWVSNFINQLPVNITYNLGVTSKQVLLAMFTLPLFLFPFLANMLNIFLAKRTKRYDIVLFSLFLYSFGILPAIMYSVVEVYTGASLLLLLFHYFVADIDYNWKDILAILLLCVCSFGLTELVMFQGVFVFFLAFYIIPKSKNIKIKIVKTFIVISQALAAIFVFIMNCFVIPGIQKEAIMFFSEAYNIERNMFLTFWQEPYLVEAVTVALFIAIFAYFNKKKMKNNIMFLIMSLYIVIFAVIICFRKQFLYDYDFISYRVAIFIIYPILLLLFFCQEALKKYLHKNILYNLLIVTLICGITNTFIQFFYSYKVIGLKERFLNIVEQSKDTFIYPEERLLSELYDSRDNMFFVILSPTSDYFSLCEDKYLDKIVLPFSRNIVMPLFRQFQFDGNLLHIHFIKLDINNEFWNMTNIKKHYFMQQEKFKKYQKRKIENKSLVVLQCMDFDKNGNIVYIDENIFLNYCTKEVREKFKKYINNSTKKAPN